MTISHCMMHNKIYLVKIQNSSQSFIVLILFKVQNTFWYFSQTRNFHSYKIFKKQMAYISLLFHKVGKAHSEEILDKHKTQTGKIQITSISSVKEYLHCSSFAVIQCSPMGCFLSFLFLHFTWKIVHGISKILDVICNWSQSLF